MGDIAVNHEGQRFGRLLVIKRAGTHDTGYEKRATWLCQCDCGNNCIALGKGLRNGSTKSCGCFKASVRHKTHNASGTRLHAIWKGMLARCRNPNRKSFSHYGKRGITVCMEWQAFEPFHEWAIANAYKDNLTIDRIDNDGPYEPQNCRWITKSENTAQRNRDIGRRNKLSIIIQ